MKRKRKEKRKKERKRKQEIEYKRIKTKRKKKKIMRLWTEDKESATDPRMNAERRRLPRR